CRCNHSRVGLHACGGISRAGSEAILFLQEEELDDMIFKEEIAALDITPYKDQRIIIKGCSDKPVPVSAYLEITRKLRPVAKSLMYGEACSNVPLFKQKANQ